MWLECQSSYYIFLNKRNVLIPYYYSARQDSVVSLSKPIVGVDGTEMQEITIPSGTTVFVSILNANRNPDLWGKGGFGAFRFVR